MKALKLVLIAAFVSFTMSSFAQEFQEAKGQTVPKMIELSVAKDLPDLAYAIKTQIDPMFFLHQSENKLFVALVKVKQRTYRVCGNYDEWYNFFYAKKRYIPFEEADKSKRKAE
jgi:hypothetical protein